MAVSSAQKELDKLGAQLAELFPNASRISVFSRPLNTAPLKEVWCSGSSGQILGMDGERVLGTVEKWKRTVLIEDARTNQLLRGVTSRQSTAKQIPASTRQPATTSLPSQGTSHQSVVTCHGGSRIQGRRQAAKGP